MSGGRPRYETPEDLQREYAVAAAVCEAEAHAESRALSWHKLPPQYAQYADVAFCRHQSVVCYAEVKCRPSIQEWDSARPPHHVVLSCHKWHNGVSFAQTMQRNWMLIVACHAGVYGLTVSPNAKVPRYKQIIGGRVVGRRDEADVEPVVCLPYGDFRLLCPTPTGLFAATT